MKRGEKKNSFPKDLCAAKKRGGGRGGRLRACFGDERGEMFVLPRKKENARLSELL